MGPGLTDSGRSANLAVVSPRTALHELLCDLFDPAELRLFVRSGADGQSVENDLPGAIASCTELADKVVGIFIRRGLVGDLFSRLRQGRPRRRADIDRVAALWSDQDLRATSSWSDLLAAQEAAWNRRVALRGGYPVPLSQLYVEPALVVPGLHGRNPLSTWLERGIPGPKRFVVVGEVGSGKTELLHVTAARMAARARVDPTAPIPLLLDAVDLQRPLDLREAATHAWPQARDAVEALLSQCSVPMVLLVDRLDETADPELDAQLVRMCDANGARLAAMIVTTRPSYRPALGEVTLLQLPRWTERDIQRFLDSLPVSVARTLRRLSGERAMVRELLAHPLTATILAVLGAEEVENLEHPVHMFRALIGQLFQRWTRNRRQPPSWDRCAPHLQRWAREVVEGDRSGIDRATLRRLIRAEHPDDGEEYVDDLQLGLGVLIPHGDRYEFLFRSLAEHLAGRQLAESGIPQILRAAREPWAQESVRHAGGCLRDDVARTELLSALLLHEGSDTPGVYDDHLRPVLSAIDITADAPAIDSAVAGQLTHATFRRLAEEYSNWVGDEVARRVPRLLQSGGSVRDQLTARCLEILLPPPVGRELPDDRPALRELLHHRDSKVCRAVIRKLHASLDDADVQKDLLQLIHDGRECGFNRDVGVEAALALREVPRARLAPEVKAKLVALLDDETSAKPFAHSVLALLPGEAPIDKLAYDLSLCIHRSLDTFEPIASLLAYPGGTAALEREFPEWREKNDQNLANADRLSTPLPCVLTPTLTARIRAAEALSSRMHLLPEATFAQILEDEDNLHALTHCFDKLDASLHAEILERKASTRWSFCPGCRQAISGAAELRGDVRDLLVHWWDVESKHRPDREGSRSYFPGEMLEPLVLDDGDAARVYAEWLVHLVHTRFINIPRDLWSHAPFRCPQVVDTVRDHIFDSHGRPREHALRLLVKGWQGDPITWERLTAHVTRVFSGEGHVCVQHAPAWPRTGYPTPMNRADDLLDALAVLDVVPPAHFLAVFREGCRRQIHNALIAINYQHSYANIVPPQLFPVLRRLDLVDPLRDALRALAGVDRPPNRALGLHAALLVVSGLEQTEQRRLSLLWAEHHPYTAQPEHLPAAELSHLISLDATAWREALVAHAERLADSPDYPHLALGVLQGIPIALAHEVLPRWLNSTQNWRLPWIERAFADSYRARIDDRLREQAFASRRL